MNRDMIKADGLAEQWIKINSETQNYIKFFYRNEAMLLRIRTEKGKWIPFSIFHQYQDFNDPKCTLCGSARPGNCEFLEHWMEEIFDILIKNAGIRIELLMH
jgi:hypothetical protein